MHPALGSTSTIPDSNGDDSDNGGNEVTEDGADYVDASTLPSGGAFPISTNDSAAYGSDAVEEASMSSRVSPVGEQGPSGQWLVGRAGE